MTDREGQQSCDEAVHLPKAMNAAIPTRAVATKPANKPFLAYVRIYSSWREADTVMERKAINSTAKSRRLCIPRG